MRQFCEKNSTLKLFKTFKYLFLSFFFEIYGFDFRATFELSNFLQGVRNQPASIASVPKADQNITTDVARNST